MGPSPLQHLRTSTWSKKLGNNYRENQVVKKGPQRYYVQRYNFITSIRRLSQVLAWPTSKDSTQALSKRRNVNTDVCSTICAIKSKGPCELWIEGPKILAVNDCLTELGKKDYRSTISTITMRGALSTFERSTRSLQRELYVVQVIQSSFARI